MLVGQDKFADRRRSRIVLCEQNNSLRGRPTRPDGVCGAAKIADFDRHLAFEVEQRRLDVDSAIAAIAAADVGIRAAQEAQRVLGERFTAGVATNTDVLDAQTDLLQAELDRTRAVAAARLAMARLDRAMGRP